MKDKVLLILFLSVVFCLALSACEKPQAELPQEHEHVFSEWITTKAPACLEEGQRTRSCECGFVETETIAPLGHDFEECFTVDVASTCKASGKKSRHCVRCDAKTDETELPLAEHLFSEGKETKVPTCTEAGEKISTCSICGATQKDEVPPLGHDPSDSSGIYEIATCEKGGKEKFTCKRCGNHFDSQTPALGHDYETEFTVVKMPTCTEYGREIRSCRREGCGAVAEERLIQPLNHDWVLQKTEDGPAPCGGIVRVYLCSREGCGKTRNETANGNHEFGQLVTESNATCEVGAWRTNICNLCGIHDTRYYAQTGHFWGSEYVVGIEPTSEHDGYQYLVCTVCGAEKPESRVAIPKYTLGVEKEFTVNVCRTEGRKYYGEATIHVFDGDTEVLTQKTSSQAAKFTLPAKDYRLTLSDLPNGYSSAEKEFCLRPGKVIAQAFVKGSFLGGQMPEGYQYKVGDSLYDLEFTTYEGETYHIGELLKEYKAIFLNFYFTTCGYCNEEFPNLIAAQKKYEGEILVVYVNGHAEDKDTVIAHAKRAGLYGSLIAEKFLIDDFPLSGGWHYPTTVFIDCDGVITECNRGAVYGDYFEKKMQEYVGYAEKSGWKKQSAEGFMPVADLPTEKKYDI